MNRIGIRQWYLVTAITMAILFETTTAVDLSTWKSQSELYPDDQLGVVTYPSDETLDTMPMFMKDSKMFGPVGLDDWSRELGLSGFDGRILSSIEYDGDLYVGGNFQSIGIWGISWIARWDGNAWNTVGQGVDGPVYCMTVWKDKLIVGGYFSESNGISMPNVAAWDDVTWAPLSSDVSPDGAVLALIALGDTLWLGGIFNGMNRQASGWSSMPNLAYFAASSFSTWGSPNGAVLALDFYESELIVAGMFSQVGSTSAIAVARRNESGWHALDAGMNGPVYRLKVFEDELYAGGAFSTAGGGAAARVASWNGTTWSPLGSGVAQVTSSYADYVNAFTVYNGELIVAGRFTNAGEPATSEAATLVARWDGSSWSDFDEARFHHETDWYRGVIETMEVYQGELFVMGKYDYVGLGDNSVINSSHISRFDGTDWKAAGSGVERTVSISNTQVITALLEKDNLLIAGGDFEWASGSKISRVAAFDGRSWNPIGPVLTAGVTALATNGDKLFVGGYFNHGGSNVAAVTDLETWEPIGSSLAGRINVLLEYVDLSVDPPHTVLLAGGDFPGYLAANDNYNFGWYSLIESPNGTVYDLEVLDGDLIVAGEFSAPADNIFRFDPADLSFNSIGGGINGAVRTLVWHNGNLYAGGNFSHAGAFPVNNIAKWDGFAWTPVGIGTAYMIEELYSFDGKLLAATYGDNGAAVIMGWYGSQWSQFGGNFVKTSFLPVDRHSQIMAMAEHSSQLFVGGEFGAIYDSWPGGAYFESENIAAYSGACSCGAINSGFTGNTDCDIDGKRNLADITRLVDHVYISKAELCCEAEGNTDGDVDGKINLADITALIDHVYISKAETAGCL